MNREPKFPLDSATLIMLRGSCQVNEDTGRTHLLDFLDMGSRVKSMTLIDEGDPGLGGMAGAPVYEEEFEDGYAPWSEHEAIVALVGEVLRLRGEE